MVRLERRRVAATKLLADVAFVVVVGAALALINWATS
jgi:hypothetical protein